MAVLIVQRVKTGISPLVAFQWYCQNMFARTSDTLVLQRILIAQGNIFDGYFFYEMIHVEVIDCGCIGKAVKATEDAANTGHPMCIEDFCQHWAPT